MRQRSVLFAFLLGPLFLVPVPAGGQGVPVRGGAATGPTAVTRDDRRSATVKAIHLSEPLRMDGELDDAVYRTEPAISEFFQTSPLENTAPTERTEAWVMFDESTIYVAARLWESVPREQWTANEMRRDTSQLRQNDHFGVSFDTFHDRRNGYFFYANPLGARADSYMTDETSNNADWNPVWEARTGRFDGGWTVEMAIPFKSLRYVSGSGQIWGINMRRAIRRKNEWNHLNPLPLSIGGSIGMMRVSADATLVGLELPPASANIELKPYVVVGSTTDHVARPEILNRFDHDAGFDAKYGINANLTADLTVHTDFAQVEVDEQQVNLTRFSVLFPEKRDFFLEGRGIFDFGRGTGGVSADTPQVFYSRRIGLNRNRVVPIIAGGRLTGKVGGVTMGAVNIQADEEDVSATPATNFTVLRVKRDILRRSSVGAIFTNRSRSIVDSGSNQAVGGDAAFSFYDNVSTGGYYARTETTTLGGDNESYQGRFNYDADRYGARADYTKVGEHFNPEIGFLRRPADFRRSAGVLRFSPRPRGSTRIRQYTYEGSVEYIENGAGHVDSRSQTAHAGVELVNSDQITVDANANLEGLVRPFEVARGVVIAPGNYRFNDLTVRYVAGQQRRASGSVTVQVGDFYDGTIRALTLSAARISISPQLSVEPSLSLNHVDVSAGAFTSSVLRARTDFAFTPRMFASGLFQYGSAEHSFSSNIRFRWEYRPASEFFVVYTDERDTTPPGFPGVRNKAFVVKINRLWQW